MTNQLQNLGNDITIQWNSDNTQIIYMMTASNRQAVDTYINSNLDMLKHWDKSKTLFTIQDISHPDVALTPYLRERLNEVTDYIKTNQIQVRTAVVLSDSLTGQLMRTFGRLFTMNAKYLKQAYFTDMQSAQEWVHKQKLSE